jgi:hypothetical protein
MEQGLREDRLPRRHRGQQQPDDAKFDTLDFGYASVRWMMNASPGFHAIGPSQIDPRSGEILDADIAFEGMFTRNAAHARSQVLAARPHRAVQRPLPFAFAAPLPGRTAGRAGATADGHAAACMATPWPPNSWPTRWT